MTFSGAKFGRFFAAATLMAAATFAIGIIIQAVSSWYLGADAFAAMAAVYPYRLLPDVLVILFAEGSAALGTQALGRSDRTTANRIFSQGALVLLAAGIVFTLGFHSFERVYLDLMGVTGEVRVQALAFGRGFVFSILSGMLQDYLRVQVYADGGHRYCLAGSLAYLVVHALTAILFVSRWGAEGLGWSVAVSTYVYLAILLLHFRSPSAALRFRPAFSPRLLVRTCALGLGSLLPQLSTILVSFVTTRIAAARFGATGLAVVAIVNGIGALSGFLQAVGLVALPLVAVYSGEGNRPGLVATMRRAARCLAIEGGLIALPLLLFPDWVTGLFGITVPETCAAMSRAVRLIGLSLVPAGFAALGGTYFQATGHIRLAGAYAFFRSLVFPAAAILVGITWCGTTGLAAGLTGETVFLCTAAAIGFLYARTRRLEFPLFLRPTAQPGEMLSLDLDADAPAAAATRVREILGGRLGPEGRRTTLWTALAAEEILTIIRDNNPARRVRFELTLDFPDGDVRLIIRDDGKIFDITSVASDINSLSSFVLARLSTCSEQSGMTMVGNNRALVLFKKDAIRNKEP